MSSIVLPISFLLSVSFKTCPRKGWLEWVKFLMVSTTTNLFLPSLSILKAHQPPLSSINDLDTLLLLASLQVFPLPPHNFPCDVCARAKHTHLPFQLNHNKSSFIFHQIYCNIWGGYSTPSSSGAHYFLTIVDDHSHATWVYLMHMKSDTYMSYTFSCSNKKEKWYVHVRTYVIKC